MELRHMAKALAIILALLPAACASGAKGCPVNSPEVSLSIGMPFSAVRDDPGPTSPRSQTSIDRVYNLRFVLDQESLVLNCIGGPGFPTVIVSMDGKVVQSVLIRPQTDEMTAAEAISRSEEIYGSLVKSGFSPTPGTEMFGVDYVDAIGMPDAASSFAEAKALLVDGRARVFRLNVFSLDRGDVGASIVIINRRRMREMGGFTSIDEGNSEYESVYTIVLYFGE